MNSVATASCLMSYHMLFYIMVAFFSLLGSPFTAAGLKLLFLGLDEIERNQQHKHGYAFKRAGNTDRDGVCNMERYHVLPGNTSYSLSM